MVDRRERELPSREIERHPAPFRAAAAKALGASSAALSVRRRARGIARTG
jgi:hypothetical protein